VFANKTQIKRPMPMMNINRVHFRKRFALYLKQNVVRNLTMKIIITFFFAFLTYRSIGQNSESPFLTSSEVRSFFNDVRPIINGGEKYFYLCDKPLNSDLPSKTKELRKHLKIYRLDSFFIKNDIDVLCKQIKQSKASIWESSYIDSTVFLRNTFIDSTLHSPIDSVRKKHKLPVFYSLTFPLFSNDKLTCYISAWYWCGTLCGHGSTYIFKRVNGHWILYRIFYGPVA
jgi:hypothetical protein